MTIDYAAHNLVPEHIRDGLRRYIEQGIPPGDFLTAVLSNDLYEACQRADDINRHRLFDIVGFLYNYTPKECWGSPERVSNWIKGGEAAVPTYPLIIIHCEKMGSMPYYIQDEIERAKSVSAPRDVFAAGALSDGPDIRLWRDIKNEEYKTFLADECHRRFGIHPNTLKDAPLP